jgi:hypothetical protein
MDLGKSAALAIGSEMSGGIRDVYMYGCTMGTVDTVVDVKSNLDRGGVVERIRAWDLKVADCGTVLEATTAYHSYAGGKFPPRLRDIEISHVSAKSARRGLVIRGNPLAPVENVRATHVTITECGTPTRVQHAMGVSVSESSFTL